ncbi:hypothetical protein MRX96_039599 [Rhipicephalus microplus]
MIELEKNAQAIHKRFASRMNRSGYPAHVATPPSCHANASHLRAPQNDVARGVNNVALSRFLRWRRDGAISRASWRYAAPARSFSTTSSLPVLPGWLRWPRPCTAPDALPGNAATPRLSVHGPPGCLLEVPPHSKAHHVNGRPPAGSDASPRSAASKGGLGGGATGPPPLWLEPLL